ncbi:hypothetical protein BD626DRAFT_499146 [Schizophyllum amplum]|uniref:Uncharacterized protein n=1 Tax=Schizophyllum amplum TaxID=97359 RepID=A0A550CC69_9AGAR|nr:hypothetical protein BD626DRAFT_499146 [Auriculariopsis ampla]
MSSWIGCSSYASSSPLSSHNVSFYDLKSERPPFSLASSDSDDSPKHSGADEDESADMQSTIDSVPPRITVAPFDDVPFSQSFSGYIEEGQSDLLLCLSDSANETIDMTFHIDRFTNIRDEVDSQWSDDDIDEIMVMSPKDYSAPSPPRPQGHGATNKGVQDASFSDFELLRDSVLDLSLSKPKVKLCKSRKTGEVFMMKSLQDCDQIVWSEEPNSPLLASPSAVVTSCRLSRVPDKDDVFRFSSFPVSTTPPMRHVSYPSASSHTICVPSSPPIPAGLRTSASLLPLVTPPPPPAPVIRPVSSFPNLSKYKCPSFPAIAEENEVLGLSTTASLDVDKGTACPTLTLEPLLNEQPQLTAEERMDLFWQSIDRDATSPLSPPLEWLRHRSSIDALLNKSHTLLSSASAPRPCIVKPAPTPIPLPDGLKQIGNGIGFTYRIPAASNSKASICTASSGAVLRKLKALHLPVRRMRKGRKNIVVASKDDPPERLSGESADVLDIYADSPWGMTTPSAPTPSTMALSPDPFRSTLSPDPFRMVSPAWSAMSPLSSNGPLTPQTPFTVGEMRMAKDADDGLRLVTQPPSGMHVVLSDTMVPRGYD